MTILPVRKVILLICFALCSELRWLLREPFNLNAFLLGSGLANGKLYRLGYISAWFLSNSLAGIAAFSANRFGPLMVYLSKRDLGRDAVVRLLFHDCR